MGSYRREYENYYNGLINNNDNKKSSVKNERSGGGYNRNYNGRRNNKKPNGYVSILVVQTTGALLLLLIIMGLKYAPYKDINNVYAAFKEISGEETFDASGLTIENIKNIDIVETFNNFKEEIKNSKDESTKKDEKLLNPIIGDVKEIEDGVTISTKEEKDVFSVFEGEVKEVKKDDSGNKVIIDHKDGTESYYSKINNLTVKIGDKVEKGECIGKNSKVKDGSYELDFKISFMGKFKNPKDYVDFKWK